MNTLEKAGVIATERLEAAGWFSESFVGEYGTTYKASNGTDAPVEYVVMGDMSAPHIILETAPHFTSVTAKHYELRLGAQQAALGNEFCVVGVGVSDPQKQLLTAKDHHDITKGDFSVFSTRLLRVAEHLPTTDSSHISLYGYSLGADVSAQTASEVMHNPSRGSFVLESLGVVEPARVAERGLLQVVGAMQSSGSKLFENIIASGMPVLNRAWGISEVTDDKKAIRKRFDRGVLSGLMRYCLVGVNDNSYVKRPLLETAQLNVAIARGFASDKTYDQVLTTVQEGVPVYVGRQTESKICPEEFINNLSAAAKKIPDKHLVITQEANDHSADDNLRLSAARMLFFSQLISG
jgi:hypothetical protein